MRPPLSADRFVMELLQLSRESQGYKELLAKFADYLKAKLEVDDAMIKDFQGSAFAASDEVTLNTGKPYIDNGLSGYSAFPELIEYSNRGFKCCAILPIVRGGKQFGTITLLSRDEKGFIPESVNLLSVASTVISSEIGSKYEIDKSLNVAKYFDASFNNLMPQLLVGTDGRIVKANKTALNYFDKNQKELSNISLADIFDMDKGTMDKLNRGLAVESFGKAYQNRIFEISPSRINDNLMHLMINEVSEEKDAEEKGRMLDKSEDEAFLVTGKDFEVLWASKGTYSLFGIQREMMVGRKFTDFVVVPNTIKDILQKLAANTYSGDVKFDFGNDITFYGKLAAYKKGNEFYCIVSRDYIRYVKSAEELSESMVEISNDPIIEVDGSGYMLSYNKPAENLFKLDSGRIGTPIYGICADSESQNKIAASLSIAKKNGYIEDVYVNLMESKNRSSIPCVQKIKAVADKNGGTASFIIVNKELLTKKNLEELGEQLQTAQKEAEKLKTESDLKSQFIYNISHDLKTPITNIMGFSKLLLTDNAETLTKEQMDYIQIIYDESERFLQLVKQILDVAKLQSGIVKLDTQQVNFNDIRNNPSIKSLAEACENKGLGFFWNVEYDVPEIPADPNRLIQVFSNLIGNAIKFTDKGEIRVRVMKKKGSVRVEVSDTGIGISKTDIPKIFKKFYQLRRGLVKQEGSGTGLGLSIAKEVVNLHGGRIGVESEVGKGSTFWFTIPPLARIKKKALKYNRAEHQTP
ncbi:MAG: ATP-binding protein [Candidatus Micrarchaeaceae archaeon]